MDGATMTLSKASIAELHRFMGGQAYREAWEALEGAYKAAIFNAITETERLQAANMLTSLEVHRRILEGLEENAEMDEQVVKQLRSVV